MNKEENYDIFALEDGATPLTPEEQQELIPSLVTRMQLNDSSPLRSMANVSNG